MQGKFGVEVPVVSIYPWDVAIFCCTFDLWQKRKGSLEVTEGWVWAALAAQQRAGEVLPKCHHTNSYEMALQDHYC